MKAVIQRVSKASVTINENIHAQIGLGLLVLLGIEDADSDADIEWLSQKIVNLRIFDDETGVMNESVIEKKGEVILVSQFTLQASTKKGNRPSYLKASKPEIAIPLYEKMIETLKLKGIKVEVGIFGADMLVDIQNDGPVTILLDSSKLF